jgi:hypothetical protein
MVSKTAFISGGLVGCMIGNAALEVQHGKAVGEVHLITSVQLVVPSTSTGTTSSISAIFVHFNTITEAEYLAPLDPSPLRLNGLTHPST